MGNKRFINYHINRYTKNQDVTFNVRLDKKSYLLIGYFPEEGGLWDYINHVYMANYSLSKKCSKIDPFLSRKMDEAMDRVMTRHGYTFRTLSDDD
jgi:hypothetical protein